MFRILYKVSLLRQNITHLRKSNNLSMDKLADILGKSKGTIKSYEDGKTLPDSDVIYKLVHHFEISYFNLFEVDLSIIPEDDKNDYSSLDREELIELVKERDEKIVSIKSSINQILDIRLK